MLGTMTCGSFFIFRRLYVHGKLDFIILTSIHFYISYLSLFPLCIENFGSFLSQAIHNLLMCLL